MTKHEVQNLLGWAIANYPSMQEKDMRMTAALWEKMLADIPYDIAEKALIKVMATSKFFPTVAEIREAVADITTSRLPTWSEAWNEVKRAIRNYGYYRPDEAMKSMSPEVARVVHHIGWQEICASEEPDVVRGQFRMAWESQAKNAREMAVLPAEVRDLIGQVSNALQRGRGEYGL
jgi:hypothetical protein